MKTLCVEYRDLIAIVKLNRGITNSINLELVGELAEVIQVVKLNPDVRGLVLSSANEKFFSIGFDIPGLFNLPREEFRLFYQAFNQLCLDLYTMPKPTVAALKGHAIAGGCILALCCDYRFMAEGRKLMELNEIKLGVPVPYPADCMLRQVIGDRSARDIVEGGEFYPSEKLAIMGMVDQVVPLLQVLPKSIDKVRVLGAYPSVAYEIIKSNRVETIAAHIRAHLNKKEQLFIERWYSKDARLRLREAMEKF